MSGYYTYGPINILWNQPVGGPASYRTMRTHWLGPRPSTAGINFIIYPPESIINEGIDIPYGWIPTLAVDPLNGSAVARFWNAGPRDLASDATNDLNLVEVSVPPQGMPVSKPVTYWQRIGFTSRAATVYVNYGPLNISGGIKIDPQGPNVWVLTGLGASLPARGP